MIDQITITHHIQKHIIGTLLYKEVARFSDLRPPKTDTNLFSYHLGVLMKAGFVKKLEKGYGLSQNGLKYVDRMSTEKMSVRTQPKIISMLVIQNSNGDILLQKRDKQPYINAWTLPYGKIHIEDRTVEIAAMREAKEKLGFDNQTLTHAGDAYIRVYNDSELLSTTLAHVFRFDSNEIVESETLKWVRPHKLSQYRLAPAVEEIATRCFFNDPMFFEEYDVEWNV
jgi:ADP-ribose pyrophosphatase YjhB (NUDIX family)